MLPVVAPSVFTGEQEMWCFGRAVSLRWQAGWHIDVTSAFPRPESTRIIRPYIWEVVLPLVFH